MTDMVEKVARAIRTYRVTWWQGIAINEWTISDREGEVLHRFPLTMHELDVQALCDKMNARAAIEAMREPSKQMADAGWRAADKRCCSLPPGSIANLYRAMLAAALAQSLTAHGGDAAESAGQ